MKYPISMLPGRVQAAIQKNFRNYSDFPKRIEISAPPTYQRYAPGKTNFLHFVLEIEDIKLPPRNDYSYFRKITGIWGGDSNRDNLSEEYLDGDKVNRFIRQNQMVVKGSFIDKGGYTTIDSDNLMIFCHPSFLPKKELIPVVLTNRERKLLYPIVFLSHRDMKEALATLDCSEEEIKNLVDRNLIKRTKNALQITELGKFSCSDDYVADQW